MARISSTRAHDGASPTTGGAEPVVVPRWEWRTFSRKSLVEFVDTYMVGHTESPSEETYILSARSMSSVTIRKHLVEAKHLDLVSPDGLECWRPTPLGQFPLPARALAALYAEWEIEMPKPNAPCWSQGQLMEQIVLPHQELFAVALVKRPTHLQVGSCRGEHVHVAVNGEHWESVALEDPEEEVVRAAVAELGMTMLPNRSYPSALARIVGGLTAP